MWKGEGEGREGRGGRERREGGGVRKEGKTVQIMKRTASSVQD